MFVALIVFLLGASLGSFLMLSVDRGSFARSLFGRSVCDRCMRVLRVHHLIPLVGWVWLSGRCAWCQHRLSYIYPLFECGLGLALLFVWIHHVGVVADPFVLDVAAWGKILRDTVFTTLLALLFLYDLRRGLLPDRITIPAILIAVVWNGLQGQSGQEVLLGALVLGGFFLAQFIASRGRWVGGGDIRMGVLLGVMLGLVGGIEALVLAYVLGASVGLWLLLFGKATRKTPLPFGTFLAIGGYMVLLWGPNCFDSTAMTFITGILLLVLIFGVPSPIIESPINLPFRAASSLPQSASRVVPDPPSTTITFVGDIMLAREVERALIKYGVDWPFAEIKSAWAESDLVVGNYEATVREVYRYEGEILAFDVLPELNVGLKNAGFTHLSLANNHGDDFGAAVTQQTRETIEALEIATFGDPIESEQHIARMDGAIPISLIGFHAFLEEPSSLINIIEEENRLGRFVIVFPHWGNEYQSLIAAQRDTAASSSPPEPTYCRRPPARHPTYRVGQWRSCGVELGQLCV